MQDMKNSPFVDHQVIQNAKKLMGKIYTDVISVAKAAQEQQANQHAVSSSSISKPGARSSSAPGTPRRLRCKTATKAFDDKPTKFKEMLAQTLAVPMTPSARVDVLLAADGISQ